MMNVIKNLKIVLLILGVVVILVVVKSIGKNRFKHDAKYSIEEIRYNNFTVGLSDFEKNKSDYLLVNLKTESNPEQVKSENSIDIPFEKLLDEPSIQKLRESDKKLLLFSDDNSSAEKAWIILDQMDFKNVFVLVTQENPEVLKYEFQPDTMARLESDSE